MTLLKRGGIRFGAPVLLSTQRTQIEIPNTGQGCRHRHFCRFFRNTGAGAGIPAGNNSKASKGITCASSYSIHN
jgi:hypothetical protein